MFGVQFTTVGDHFGIVVWGAGIIMITSAARNSSATLHGRQVFLDSVERHRQLLCQIWAARADTSLANTANMASTDV
jgi:hypothetical protein